MKGKTAFTESEINQIKKLINQKLLASSNEQKTIRNKIRIFGFYFSDFSSKKGYTVHDFDHLIKMGEIKIVGQDKIKIESKSVMIEKHVFEYADIENDLILNREFCSIKYLDKDILNATGFYCIKLKSNSRLPDRYQKILDKRTHKYIYIGKAEGQSLRERLSQELELKKPGTFFRSIACVLEYLPENGHLKGKSNQNNFKFSKTDKEEIIEWLYAPEQLHLD